MAGAGAEATPHQPEESWTFSIDGLVDSPHTWTWQELHALPGSTFFGDIHCVTTWSKLDTTFSGVSVDDLLEVAKPQGEAGFVMAHSITGYTTNLPLSDVTGGKAWVVSSSTASRSPASTAVRSGCWCHTCTSGSRPSGSRASS